MIAEGQLDLFPRATEAHLEAAKRDLEKYQKAKLLCFEFEKKGIEKLKPKQQELYFECKEVIEELELAVRIIQDPEVRDVMKYRYIDGHPYTVTIEHFTRMMDDRTVDRKLNCGIESVAESLLAWRE